MKKIIFLLSCVLLIAVTSDAQKDSTAKKTKKERIQNHKENMDSTQKQKLKDKGVTKENIKELDLSSEQRKQVDDIVVNTKKEKEKIKNDASLTDAQKEEKIRAVEKDSKGKMNNVLTPEQKAKMKKKRAKDKPE